MPSSTNEPATDGMANPGMGSADHEGPSEGRSTISAILMGQTKLKRLCMYQAQRAKPCIGACITLRKIT